MTSLNDISKILLHKSGPNNTPQYEYIVLALMISILVIIIIVAILWQSINNSVKSSARCTNMTSMYKRDKDIVVYAKDRYDNPMYKITYNLQKRSNKLQCACKEGSVANTFKNVSVYDIKSHKSVEKDLPCNCEETFDAVDAINTYYYGEPGLVRYMATGDKSVFDPAYIE